TLNLDQVLREGVRNSPDISVIATRSARGIQVLMWNYHDSDLAAPDSPVDLTVSGLPAALKMALREHPPGDATPSNAFSPCKAGPSPPGKQWAHLNRPPTISTKNWRPAAGCSFSLRQSGFRLNAAQSACDSICRGKACLWFESSGRATFRPIERGKAACQLTI